jgi:hypothetical protein
LKKRQSVAYQQPNQGIPGSLAQPIPAVPSLPTLAPNNLVPLPTTSSNTRIGGGSGSGNQLGLPGARSGTGQGQQQVTQRTQGENQLFATGLDVDQLASEGFKPEDCESCISPLLPLDTRKA